MAVGDHDQKGTAYFRVWAFVSAFLGGIAILSSVTVAVVRDWSFVEWASQMWYLMSQVLAPPACVGTLVALFNWSKLED